jgi:hypothetical protein
MPNADFLVAGVSGRRIPDGTVVRGADLGRGLLTNKNSSLKVEPSRRWSQGVLKGGDGRGNYVLGANLGSLIYFKHS